MYQCKLLPIFLDTLLILLQVNSVETTSLCDPWLLAEAATEAAWELYLFENQENRTTRSGVYVVLYPKYFVCRPKK